MPATYPLDLTGVSPANLVVDELHTVSEAQYRDYHFIVPDLAPFYVDNFRLKLSLNGVETVLTEDVHFSFALPYVTGTRVTGKQMYGAIVLHNLDQNGVLKNTYQTIGGDQVCDRIHVLSTLADKAYNPRTTVFDTITNLPTSFPPVPHYQDYDTMYGQEAVVTALNAIVNAIATNSSLTSANITEFLRAFGAGESNLYVKKAGDTLTGPLYLANTPVDPTQAATKQYVDNKLAVFDSMTSVLSGYATVQLLGDALMAKVSKTGDIMTGPLLIHGAPVDGDHVTNKSYVDAEISRLQGLIDQLSEALGGVSGDYATKAYVDGRVDETRVELYRYL